MTNRLLSVHRFAWRLAALRVVLRAALLTAGVSHQKSIPNAMAETVSRLWRVGCRLVAIKNRT